MAKKQKDVEADELGNLADAVSASAQQIWQAGLGAFVVARRDGGKLFDALVHDGAQFHTLTREIGGGKVPAIAGKVGQLAEDVARQANASWEKAEQYIEDRIASTLHRMGVPSREEVDMLRHEIAALEAALRGAAGARRGAKAIAPAPVARAAKAGVKRRAANGSAAKRPA